MVPSLASALVAPSEAEPVPSQRDLRSLSQDSGIRIGGVVGEHVRFLKVKMTVQVEGRVSRVSVCHALRGWQDLRIVYLSVFSLSVFE